VTRNGRLSGSAISTLLLELGAEASAEAKKALLAGGQTILSDAKEEYTVSAVRCRQVGKLRSINQVPSLELYLMRRVLQLQIPLAVICTLK